MDKDIKNIIESNEPKIYDRSDETMDIISTVRNSIELFARYKFPEIYSIIKSKVLYAWDMRLHFLAMGDEDSTAEVYPLISSVHDSFVANLYDTNISPRVSATKEEFQSKAESAQNFLDWANDISNSEKAKQLIRAEAALIGTSYGMCWWDRRDKKITIPRLNWEAKTLDRSISQPVLDHVSFFEMFYDIGTRDFYNARWKVRRKIMSTENIVKAYDKLKEWGFTDEDKEKINDTIWDVISNKDYTKIYNIKNYEHLIEDEDVLQSSLTEFLEENVLTTIDENNKFNEVIEFYTSEKMIVLINGHEYINIDNPFPLWDPFAIITYEAQIGTCMGIGLGHKLMPYQRNANMYWCNIKDALMRHLRPMYQYVKGTVRDVDGEAPFILNYVPWKMYETEDKNSISAMPLISTDAISLGISQLNDTIAKAYESIGTNNYVQWGQGKVERSLGAANLKVQIMMTRLKPLNHSMGAFEQRVFEQWLTLAAMNMDDEQEIRVFGEDGNESFVKIEPLDLIDKFDITVDVDALRDLTRNERAKGAIELLNSIAQYNINPISQTPAIAPETVIEYLTGELDFKLKPMNDAERAEYTKRHVELTKQIQEWTGNTPWGKPIQNEWTIPQPQEQIPQIPNIPQVDVSQMTPDMVPWLI